MVAGLASVFVSQVIEVESQERSKNEILCFFWPAALQFLGELEVIAVLIVIEKIAVNSRRTNCGFCRLHEYISHSFSHCNSSQFFVSSRLNHSISLT